MEPLKIGNIILPHRAVFGPKHCDKVVLVNGDEGNKYLEVFCPEKPRLV